jgi:gliding motility-associated-like protein
LEVRAPVRFCYGNPISDNATIDQLTPAAYELSIADEQGCRFDTTLVVTQEECEIFIPNVFSPNGDGINDEFRIFSGAGFPATVKTYRIFNRWGALVYEADNFSLESDGFWWNGRQNQEWASEETYVYFIEIELEDGSVEEFSGEVGVIH